MNRYELANVISQKIQISGYDADRFLRATLNTIIEIVTSKQPVELDGFGTFSMRPQAPRSGTVPATGQPIQIPARWAASFKIDKAFKNLVEAVPIDTEAPTTSNFVAPNITSRNDKPYTFTLEYDDSDTGISAGTIGRDETKPENFDIQVSGPNAYSQKARAITTKSTPNKKGKIVTYAVGAPGGIWDASANGTYEIFLLEGQISDAHGNAIPTGRLGSFLVDIPV
ncbi:HU family DNA-binding protein [Tumidithrix elongata RA019]|uniref:HU family DNA-binding protein n=1 Tax=Tumidithrix elongata BACA0141 TaxID=2716417 RepID=A0AAW9PVZ9_9CYAN|nr:HU family DNA-binding protein [Tumidithrix elongata RA019]